MSRWGSTSFRASPNINSSAKPASVIDYGSVAKACRLIEEADELPSLALCGAASESAARQNVIYWESSCVDPRLNKRNLKTVLRTEIDGTGFGWYNVEFMWSRSAEPCTERFPKPLDSRVDGHDSAY